MVNEDPNYELPPGFVKFKTSELKEHFRGPEHFREAAKISIEILDDLLVENNFGHYLYP